MRELLILGALLATPALAGEQDMTCRGAIRAERIGLCHFNIATPGIERIRACNVCEVCIVRARVVPNGEPVEGWGQHYQVLKIHSARNTKEWIGPPPGAEEEVCPRRGRRTERTR
jgi:hypothetical protein